MFSARPLQRQLWRLECLLDCADARARQQRKRDDRDFPEIDLIELAHARLGIDLAAHRAIADRQPVDGALLNQRQQLAAGS